MSWAKRLRRLNNLKAILIPIISLIMVFFLFSLFFKFFFNQPQQPKLQPAEYLEINEPFSAQLYFNNEMGTDIFSREIVNAINKSQKTIELAVYSMNDTRIRDAIYAASQRGIKVTLIFSDKRQAGHDEVFKNLPKDIIRQDIPSTRGSMHHKFLLIDREEAQAQLFFGTYNFTYLQEKYDPCFLLQTTRPEIINIFGEEFDRIRAGYHGPDKLSASPNPFAARIKYQEGFLEIWFSPQPSSGGLKERMLGLIKDSSKNIKMMVWDFTSNDLATGIIAAAANKTVKIITDDVNYSLPESAFNLLLAEKKKRGLNNLEIITDTKRNQEIKDNFNEPDLNSFLHHHLMILDDKIAVFGTNNWSSNGFYNNDESIMISDINYLVQGFEGVWEFNYNKNK